MSTSSPSQMPTLEHAPAHARDLAGGEGMERSGAEGPGGSDLVAQRANYERLRSALLAIPTSELLVVNVDLDRVGRTARMLLPAIDALGPELGRLSDADRFPFEILAPVIDVLLYVEEQSDESDEHDAARKRYRALLLEGRRVRRLLLADAKPLIRRGFLSARALERFRYKPGTQSLIADLEGLTDLLGRVLPALGGRTPLTASFLASARQLAGELREASHLSRHYRTRGRQPTFDRRRAFTLFVRTYEAVRRAIAFLRGGIHAGPSDVRGIAPSIRELSGLRASTRRAKASKARIPRPPRRLPRA